jgi:hypothetical protein
LSGGFNHWKAIMQTISRRIYRIETSRPSIPNPEAEKALTAIVECLDGLALSKSSGDPNVQKEIEAVSTLLKGY